MSNPLPDSTAPGLAFIAATNRSSHWSSASLARPLPRFARPLARFGGSGVSAEGLCELTLAAKSRISGNEEAMIIAAARAAVSQVCTAETEEREHA
jgi:hypothetical protein